MLHKSRVTSITIIVIVLEKNLEYCENCPHDDTDDVFGFCHIYCRYSESAKEIYIFLITQQRFCTDPSALKCQIISAKL